MTKFLQIFSALFNTADSPVVLKIMETNMRLYIVAAHHKKTQLSKNYKRNTNIGMVKT